MSNQSTAVKQARIRALVGKRFPQHFAQGGVVSPFQLGGGAMLDPTPLGGQSPQTAQPQFNVNPFNSRPMGKGGPMFLGPPISSTGQPTLLPGQQAQLDAQGLGSFMPPPPIGPVGDAQGTPSGASINPYNTQPIGNKGQRRDPGSFLPPPPMGPIDDGGQPIATDSGGGNPTISPGSQPAVSGDRASLIAGLVGQDPNIDPALLAQGTQPWFMQQKFGGGGQQIGGFSRGGVIPGDEGFSGRGPRPRVPQYKAVGAYKSRMGM